MIGRCYTKSQQHIPTVQVQAATTGWHQVQTTSPARQQLYKTVCLKSMLNPLDIVISKLFPLFLKSG